jgi:hypothetical protein
MKKLKLFGYLTNAQLSVISNGYDIIKTFPQFQLGFYLEFK